MLRIFERSVIGMRAAAAVLVLGGLLAGCGATLSGLPVVGVPEEARKTSSSTREYPPVGQSQFTRTNKPLTTEQRAKQEAELTRDRTEAATKKRKEIEQAAPR